MGKLKITAMESKLARPARGSQ